MSIIVQENDVRFTKIANVLITDQRLSAGAKVLYCYLRSKPSNWKVINADIIKNLQVSQETVAKYFKELISAGWIVRKKETNEKGQMLGGYIYFLFDLPKETKSETKPDAEKILIWKNPLDNNKTNIINNTNLIKKTYTDIIVETKKNEIEPVKKKSPQAIMGDYFRSIYKKHTGYEYLAKAKDYILLAELIKEYGIEKVKQKIDWLEAGCKNRVFWFAKESGINSFTIGKLYLQWNEILPQYTAQQIKEQEEKKKEEERMKRVLAEAQKLREERGK